MKLKWLWDLFFLWKFMQFFDEGTSSSIRRRRKFRRQRSRFDFDVGHYHWAIPGHAHHARCVILTFRHRIQSVGLHMHIVAGERASGQVWVGEGGKRPTNACWRGWGRAGIDETRCTSNDNRTAADGVRGEHRLIFHRRGDGISAQFCVDAPNIERRNEKPETIVISDGWRLQQRHNGTSEGRTAGNE